MHVETFWFALRQRVQILASKLRAPWQSKLKAVLKELLSRKARSYTNPGSQPLSLPLYKLLLGTLLEVHQFSCPAALLSGLSQCTFLASYTPRPKWQKAGWAWVQGSPFYLWHHMHGADSANENLPEAVLQHKDTQNFLICHLLYKSRGRRGTCDFICKYKQSLVFFDNQSWIGKNYWAAQTDKLPCNRYSSQSTFNFHVKYNVEPSS